MMRWWIKLILGLAAIAILCLLIVRIGSIALDVLQNGESTDEKDPMFAVEEPTQAPLAEEEESTTIWQDNSANWDQSVQTPVDQTAKELEEEERNRLNSENPSEDESE